MQFGFSTYFSYDIMMNKDAIIKGIIYVYDKVDVSKAEFTFYTIVPTFVVFECLFFASGIWGVYKKSLSGLDIFNFICLMAMISDLLLGYIQKFNLLIFTGKVVSFLYARYLWDLIIRLVVLVAQASNNSPAVNQNQNHSVAQP